MNTKAIMAFAGIYVLYAALLFLKTALGPAAIEPFQQALIVIPMVNVYNLTKLVPNFVGELVSFLVLNLKYEQPADIDELLAMARDIVLNIGILALVLPIAV